MAAGFVDHGRADAHPSNQSRSAADLMARAADKTLIIDTPQERKHRLSMREIVVALVIVTLIIVVTWIAARR